MRKICFFTIPFLILFIVGCSNNSSISSTPIVTTEPQVTPTPDDTFWTPMPLMGVESHRPNREDVVSLLSDAGAKIVRINGVKWYEVEPQQGQYNWAALQNLDIGLQNLSARNIETILIVRGTPSWAQKIPESLCGPILQENLQDFAVFVGELVKRYSIPPYNVKYWELGNEPDVAPELVPPTHPFGCWGETDDQYYGGEYYAEMLKVVYPAIKTADPDAQVLIGGLLLDCDPSNPPEGKDCIPARFLNGILANGGANYFDIVSFHGYAHYVNQSLEFDINHPAWKQRGGVVVGKVNYLQEVMAEFGISKPIFLTEGSLTCPKWNSMDCNPPDENFYQIQADYLIRLFVRNWALGVPATIWYDFEGQGWLYGGLVGEDSNNPKPAYKAYKFMIQKLKDMAYTGPVAMHEGIQGYAFKDGNRETWVLWSIDEEDYTIDIPEDVTAIFDKFGDEISMQETTMMISSPVYMEFIR
jgi:hypothetical protein